MAKNEMEKEPNICGYRKIQEERCRAIAENWWYGCPSFFRSPNHMCKHLIRIYIGPNNIDIGLLFCLRNTCDYSSGLERFSERALGYHLTGPLGVPVFPVLPI